MIVLVAILALSSAISFAAGLIRMASSYLETRDFLQGAGLLALGAVLFTVGYVLVGG